MKDNNTGKAKLLMSVSMGIWGTLGLFTKQIAVSSGELALYRAVLAVLLLAAVLLISRQRIDLSAVKRELALLLLSGMAMGINWVLLFEAYKYTTVSLATLSYYFAPVIVTISCPILFKEKLSVKQFVCFVMSTLGLVLIIGVGRAGDTDGIGILLGLGAAVFYASVVLMNKYIKSVSGLHRTLLQFLGAIIILIPYVAFTGGVNFTALTSAGWICLLVVGFVHTGVTYCMYFSSLKSVSGQSAAILSYIDPLVAVITSVLLLKEAVTIPQLIGGALILGFALYNEL